MEQKIRGVLRVGGGGITPVGTIDITENGTYDVTEYESANVDVKGIDTTDATATANDILLGKTAYVDGEKVEGAIETYDYSNSESVAPASRSLKALLDYTKTTANLFNGNTNIIDLTGIISYNDTEKVTDMNHMFNYCSNLTTIPLFNTKNVTNMSGMFYNCKALTSVAQYDTSSVTTMREMFYYCWNLTTIPQLNTSNVTDMQKMFSSCEGLTTIPQLNTSNVTDMARMVQNCIHLKSFPQLDTSKVSSMSYMVYNCYELETIPTLNTNKVIGFVNTFYNCYVLPLIDITHYNISSTENSSNMCYGCYSLKALVIRSFGSTYALKSNAFTHCYHILGTTSPTNNPNGDKDGYIYVPRAMKETLTTATNWSTYATQYRALEDYTKDGTTTGELDLVKMGLEVA